MTDLDMTPTGALFTLPGATPGTTQWRIDSLQIVRWGTFEGPLTVRFDHGTTLMSGASGTGKSTLLDALTALMQESNISFNRASNDASGRVRGIDQRNLVSYIRGHVAMTTDDEGSAKPRVLRGDKTATWSAIAASYRDDHGNILTPTVIYYLPPRANGASEITVRRIVVPAPLDLRDLDSLVGNRFQPRELTARFDGAQTFDSYTKFINHLYLRLGIGANGNGRDAMRLLAKVQSSESFPTVDLLYKEMVLERPGTFVKAELTVTHFDRLDDNFQKMVQAQRKEALLDPIGGYWQSLTEAREAEAMLTGVGFAQQGTTPLTVWATRREVGLVEVAEALATARSVQLSGQAREAARAAADSQATADQAHADYLSAGGSDLQELAAQIEQAEATMAARHAKLAEVTERTQQIAGGVDLTDRIQFDALRSVGAEVLVGYAQADRDLSDSAWPLHRRCEDLKGERSDHDDELKRLSRTGTRIDRRLDDLRQQVCTHARLDVKRAPFLAELVAVAGDQMRWTTAVETVYGPIATRMLVPADEFERFSRAVDDLHMRGQLNFDAATEHLPVPGRAPENTTAGKLDFKPDTPYLGWVMRRVAEDGRNAVCVTTADELGGGGYRVTLSGQTRRGLGGSIGRRTAVNVLGFSNADLIDEHERAIARIDAELAAVERDLQTLTARRDAARREHAAHQYLAAIDFTQIDARGAQAALDGARARRAALVSDDLLNLERRWKSLAGDSAKAHSHAGRLASDAEEAEKKAGDLATRKDNLVDDLERYALSGHTVTDEQTAWLDARYTDVLSGGEDTEERWADRRAATHRSLRAAMESAVKDRDKALRDLEHTFALYVDEFAPKNLAATWDAYPDFQDLLDEVRASELAGTRDQWRDSLITWTSQHLFDLHLAMTSSLDEIDARMAPINRILAGLPFGPLGHRLSIRVRRLSMENVVSFKARLARLTSTATTDLSGMDDARLKERFAELKEFMLLLRGRDDVRLAGHRMVRDGLLDVRNHVQIEAVAIGTDGREAAVFRSLDTASGGENQELVAFILGAALRFRLGDEDRERPRFAPVFLDEGFVKADPEFTQRAVQAWTELGFQIIVAAPIEKAGSLEPYMRSVLTVTKDRKSNLSSVKMLVAEDRSAALEKIRRDAAEAAARLDADGDGEAA